MFNNMLIVEMNFGYSTILQSYPNTMNYSSIQTPDIDSRCFTSLDINKGPEHPSAD